MISLTAQLSHGIGNANLGALYRDPGSSKKNKTKTKSPKDPQSTTEVAASAANLAMQSSQAPGGPEAQNPTQQSSESLLAGLQEHAARDEPHPVVASAVDQPQQMHSPPGPRLSAQDPSMMTSAQEQQQSTIAVAHQPSTHNEPYQTPYQATSSV